MQLAATGIDVSERSQNHYVERGHERQKLDPSAQHEEFHRQNEQQHPQGNDEIPQWPEGCEECVQLLARLLRLPGVSLRPPDSKLRQRRRERIQETHPPPRQQQGGACPK